MQAYRAARRQVHARNRLVQPCQMEGCASCHAVDRSTAQGICCTGFERALGHIGCAAVGVGCAECQLARALFGDEACATLAKRDAGTLVLAGANSYSGGTALKEGRLDQCRTGQPRRRPRRRC